MTTWKATCRGSLTFNVNLNLEPTNGEGRSATAYREGDCNHNPQLELELNHEAPGPNHVYIGTMPASAAFVADRSQLLAFT